jgi:hypothetical protein
VARFRVVEWLFTRRDALVIAINQHHRRMGIYELGLDPDLVDAWEKKQATRSQEEPKEK